jgi:replication factor A1
MVVLKIKPYRFYTPTLEIEGTNMENQIESAPVETRKVGELNPQTKRVNLLVKVISVGDAKEIPNRFGAEPRRVAEAVVGDETGTVILSLWQDQIGTVQADDVLEIENGYISLVQGHMRLNVGKYGKIVKSEKQIPEVNSAVNLSDAEHEQERRRFGPRPGGFRPGGQRRDGYRGGYGGGRRY